jgi:hypothetical protein
MNCFRHRNVVAIALCRSCGKGLCEECAIEVPNGVACKNSCEERVAFINKMLDANREVMRVSNTQSRSHALLTVVMAFVFAVFAVAAGFNDLGFIAAFFGVAAVVLLGYGVLRLRAQRYPSQPTNS